MKRIISLALGLCSLAFAVSFPSASYADSSSRPYKVMYRLYNPNSGEHFYTNNYDESQKCIKAGWRDEQFGWLSAQPNSSPVYRLYNRNGGEHHYTLDPAEKDMLVNAGWRYEGISCYSESEDYGTPVYREYNPNQFANNHNFTTDKAEHDYLVSIGWKDEGIAWYGYHLSLFDDTTKITSTKKSNVIFTNGKAQKDIDLSVPVKIYLDDNKKIVETDYGVRTFQHIKTTHFDLLPAFDSPYAPNNDNTPDDYYGPFYCYILEPGETKNSIKSYPTQKALDDYIYYEQYSKYDPKLNITLLPLKTNCTDEGYKVFMFDSDPEHYIYTRVIVSKNKKYALEITSDFALDDHTYITVIKEVPYTA